MRKLLALFLVLAMLIPLCIFSASAEGEPVISADSSIVKARYGTVTLDGTAEQALAVDTAFVSLSNKFKTAKDDSDENTLASGYVSMGASWSDSTDCLYLALLSEQIIFVNNGDGTTSNNRTVQSRTKYAITAVTVTTENGSYAIPDAANTTWYQFSDDSSFVEMQIPLSALVTYADEDGNVYAKLKASVTTNGVTEVFDGCVLFTMEKVTYSNTAFGEKGTELTYNYYQKSAGSAVLGGNNGLYTQKVSIDTTTDVKLNQFQTVGYDKEVFKEGESNSVSFDFMVDGNMPVSAPKASETSSDFCYLAPDENGTRALIYIGIGKAMYPTGTWRGWATSQFVFGIYNTADGLVLYFDDAKGTDDGNNVTSGENYSAAQNGIKLNKKAGEQFKFEFAWELTEDSTSYRFAIAVNGDKVGTVTAEKENVYVFAMARGTGVALGSANSSKKSDANLQNNGCYFSYSNLAISSIENGSKLDTLLNKYGFLSDGAAFQTPTEGTNAVRFLTKVEDLDYSAVGFKVTATYNGKSATVTKTTTQVFESIVADGKTVSGEGKYWMAAVINCIPTDKEVILEVRPFVVTPDNVTIYGYCGTVTLNGTN